MKLNHIAVLLAFAVGVLTTIGITNIVSTLRTRSTASMPLGDVDFREAWLGDAIKFFVDHKANASLGVEFMITPSLANDLRTPAVSLSLSNATLSTVLDQLEELGLCSYRIDNSYVNLSEHPSGVLARATAKWDRPDPLLNLALEQATNICNKCGNVISEESANINLHRGAPH